MKLLVSSNVAGPSSQAGGAPLPEAEVSEAESGPQVRMVRFRGLQVPEDFARHFNEGLGAQESPAAWANAEWARLAYGTTELLAEFDSEMETMMAEEEAERTALVWSQKQRRMRLREEWKRRMQRHEGRMEELSVLGKALGKGKEKERQG